MCFLSYNNIPLKNRNLVVNFCPQKMTRVTPASQLMETSSNVQGRSAYEQQIWKFQNYYSTLLFQPQRHASCSDTSIIVILTPSWNAVIIYLTSNHHHNEWNINTIGTQSCGEHFICIFWYQKSNVCTSTRRYKMIYLPKILHHMANTSVDTHP